MARVYDVVCLNCGEVMEWCKYDAPFETCEYCGEKLTTKNKESELIAGAYDTQSYDAWDRSKVEVFGVWSCSTDVEARSDEIREQYLKDNLKLVER